MCMNDSLSLRIQMKSQIVFMVSVRRGRGCEASVNVEVDSTRGGARQTTQVAVDLAAGAPPFLSS